MAITFVEFHNCRKQTLKTLTAPNRRLTPAELERIDAQISEEWEVEKVDPAKLVVWENRLKAKRRRLGGLGDARPLANGDNAHDGGDRLADAVPGQTPRLLWNLSKDRKHVMPPPIFSAAVTPTRTIDAARKQLQEDTFIKRPVPARKASVDNGWGHLCDCKSHKKNFCREHCDDPAQVRSVDRLAKLLNAYVNQLPADDRRNAEHVFMVESQSAAVPHMEIYLLVNCHASPKMQIYARCGLERADGSVVTEDFGKPALPYTVCILDRPARLGRGMAQWNHRRSYDLVTSDEVCLRLLRRLLMDVITPLSYTILDGESLLRMQITSVGSPFELPRAAPRAKRTHVHLPAIFNQDDPFSAGREEGRPQDPAESLDAGYIPLEFQDVDSDIEYYDGGDEPPAEFADAVEEHLAEVHLIPAAILDAPVDVGAYDLSGARGGSSSSVGSAHVLSDADDSRLPLLPEIVDACDVLKESGYVSCPLGPWAAFGRPIGRITTWPETEPEFRRNLGCKCYMHPACSVSTKRSWYTDKELVVWLLMAKPLPATATAQEKQAAKRMHMQAWREQTSEWAPGHDDVAGPSGGGVASASGV